MTDRTAATVDRVLVELLHSLPISRADLARKTHLSRAAVTNVIDDLLGLGVIEDGIPTRSATGRKSVGIRLVLPDYFVVVVRINRRELTFRLYDGIGTPLQTQVVPFHADIKAECLLHLLFTGIDEMLAGRDRRFLLGISISVLGWLLRTDGKTIAHVDGFSELGTRDIREATLERYPGTHVFLEHDAKTSALAEYQDYVSQTQARPTCVLSIVGGIGFGGGIIINGEVFRGQGGIAGEVGHMGINFNSTVRSSDADRRGLNGLFEDFASPRALRESVLSRLIDFPETSLTEDSTTEDIYLAFESGDPLAEWAMNRMSQLTAYGLAGLVFILNPDLIVLGDKFPVSEAFLLRLKEHLGRYLPSALMELLDVRVSRLGDDGVLFGSYLLLMQHYQSTSQLYEKIRTSRMETQ